MNKIDKETLIEAAHNLKFDISEEEILVLQEEFDDIEIEIEFIKTLPHIDEVEPMVFPYEIYTDYLREDIPDTPLQQEEVLRNAKKVVDGQIAIPKVVK